MRTLEGGRVLEFSGAARRGSPLTESGGTSCEGGAARRAAEAEAAVIARVRAGEAEAYAALVRAHTAVALRAAVAYGAGAEAEDVVQQAFFKAYRSLGRFKDGAAFRPWLLRIVVNETRNTVRSAGRQRAVAGREAELLPGEPPIPDGADPAVAAEEGERRRQLLAALDGLGEDHRQVVIHRYLLELDETETAEALGWPRGTVKSRLSRALKKLGLALEGGDGHGGRRAPG